MKYIKLSLQLIAIILAMYIVRPLEAVYRGVMSGCISFRKEFKYYMWPECKGYNTKALYKAVIKEFKSDTE